MAVLQDHLAYRVKPAMISLLAQLCCLSENLSTCSAQRWPLVELLLAALYVLCLSSLCLFAPSPRKSRATHGGLEGLPERGSPRTRPRGLCSTTGQTYAMSHHRAATPNCQAVRHHQTLNLMSILMLNQTPNRTQTARKHDCGGF